MAEIARVSARGVVKTYGATRALAGVDVTFEPGTVTAVEGANGSGKSTLLAILARLVAPTRGTVDYGVAPGAERDAESIRAQIGLLTHAPMMPLDLSALEGLALFARLFSVRDPAARVADLRERFEIGAFAERPLRTYSRGQLQRVALARALLHAPTLVLLDEPTTGLDVPAVERLMRAVEVERDRGAIVVLATHDMAFAGRVASRRLKMERGKLA